MVSVVLQLIYTLLQETSFFDPALIEIHWNFIISVLLQHVQLFLHSPLALLWVF